jgi:hypothetical protein
MQRALRCPFLANTRLNTTIPYVQKAIYVMDEIQDKRCFICCSASERRKGWNISLILELYATHDITMRWHFKATVSKIQLISAPRDLERWRDEFMVLDDLQRVQRLAAWLDQTIFQGRAHFAMISSVSLCSLSITTRFTCCWYVRE